MLTVGLTGGIACGKSFVSELIAKKGALIVDLDQVAREIVQPGTAAWSDIISVFGSDIVDKKGNIKRKELGQVVFNDERLRQKLNDITHGRIIKHVQKEMDKFYNNPKNRGKALIIVAPLLIESGMDKMVDKIIVIICKEEIQKRRLMLRDKITEEDSIKRIKAQLPLEEKAMYADFIIDNSYSPENTSKEVNEIWDRLMKGYS